MYSGKVRSGGHVQELSPRNYMLAKGTPFQLILILIFSVGAVAGVIAFATFRSASEEVSFKTPIVIWGTMPHALFQEYTEKIVADIAEGGLGIPRNIVVYYEVDPLQFEHYFLDAVVAGRGPDLLLLPHSMLATFNERLFPVPYEWFPARRFLDEFTEIGEIYLGETGIHAFPFAVDPLVMYWNRTHFSQAGVLKPPAHWDEFLQLSPILTKRDTALNIQKSAVALGEFANVTHAKAILSLLIMQAGNPIRAGNFSSTRFVLNESMGFTIPPTESAIRFFNDFANPVKPIYAWNRSLPESKNAFLADDLAVYFGFASEFSELKAKNANLNFDIAPVPQARDVGTRLAYANMYGFSIPRTSVNIADAFRLTALLTSARGVQMWSDVSNLSPTHRSLLAAPPADPFRSVIYGSAVIARTWLDPDFTATDAIFQNMVEASATGRLRVSDAVKRANGELDLLLQ